MDRGGRSSGGGSSSRDREDRDRGSFRGDKRDNRDRDRGNRSDRFDRGADRADRDRGDRDRDRRSRRNRKKEGDDDYPLITPTMILGAKPLVRPVEAAQGVPTASPQQQHQHQQLYQPPQQSSIMGSLPNRTLYTPPSGVPTTPGTPPHPSTASAAAQRTPMLARSPAGAPTAAAMTSPSVASQARTKSPSKQVSPQHQQQQQPALGDIRVLRQINPAKRPLFQQQNPRAIKFINDKLEIALESVMKILSDTNDFSVVGVLGYQGVGKSTVANELCGKSPFFDTAHTADGSETTIVPAEHHSMDDVPFNVQRPEHWIEARHETNGIDIYVTPERLIVLDVQPLFSSSILYQAFLKDSKMSTDVMSYENFVDQMSIQLGIFIFSICHVVLIVQEDLFDTRMLKFVQTMRMLQSGVPNACSNILSMPASSSSTASQPQAAPILSPSTAGSAASAAAATTTSSASQQLHQQSTATITIPQPLVSAEYVPEIVFVYNKASEKQFSAHSVDEVQNFLDLYFENTPFRKNGFIHPFSWAEVQPAGGANDAASTSSSSTAPLSTTMTTKKHAAGGVNFFILPFNNSNKRSSASNHDSMKNPISLLPARDSYETLSKTLRMLISSLPKKPFERNVSEKEWVQNAYRLWAIIMKSSKFLSEYNRTFQKLQLYKT